MQQLTLFDLQEREEWPPRPGEIWTWVDWDHYERRYAYPCLVRFERPPDRPGRLWMREIGTAIGLLDTEERFREAYRRGHLLPGDQRRRFPPYSEGVEPPPVRELAQPGEGLRIAGAVGEERW